MENKQKIRVEINGSDGSHYNSVRQMERETGIPRRSIRRYFDANKDLTRNGVTYSVTKYESISANKRVEVVEVEKKRPDEKEYKEFLDAKRKQKQVKELSFVDYNFSYQRVKSGYRYAVALFSDAHIEETVKKESVLGMNEYNLEIAHSRINAYFNNLANCINEDKVDTLIFASLGDTISGYIHEELSQCNGISPTAAIIEAQSLIVSGLKFLCENTDLMEIKFVGIVGNHSRTTKKIQHANGYEMSYEYLMYQNIKQQCEVLDLPIEFCIPKSEFARIVAPDGRVMLFAHGFQVKSNGTGTVCGIYPALNRLFLKHKSNIGQDKVYIGHFHSCTDIPNTMVNGSIIGFNTFALSNGFQYEEPAQMYEVYDTKIGQLLTRKIYCK